MAYNMYNVPYSMSLWGNGPQPGALYDFPGNAKGNVTSGAIQRTQTPSTSGTSVLGLVYKGGVIVAADTLGSYGSLARFRSCSRVMKVNNSTVLGAGGDYADYQYLKRVIEDKVIEEECLSDGFTSRPQSLHSWVTRILYNRRSEFDPLWTTFVIAGLQNKKPYLGYVDKLGTAFESTHIATGYGAYMALPLLRDAYEAKPEMTFQEAKEVMVNCLRVLCYRDARAFYKYEFAIADEEGVRIEGPFAVDTNWDIAHFVRD